MIIRWFLNLGDILSFFISLVLVTFHSISLAWACLAVSEYSRMISFDNLLHHMRNVSIIKDLRLGSRVPHYLVKFVKFRLLSLFILMNSKQINLVSWSINSQVKYKPMTTYSISLASSFTLIVVFILCSCSSLSRNGLTLTMTLILFMPALKPPPPDALL